MSEEGVLWMMLFAIGGVMLVVAVFVVVMFTNPFKGGIGGLLSVLVLVVGESNVPTIRGQVDVHVSLLAERIKMEGVLEVGNDAGEAYMAYVAILAAMIICAVGWIKTR